MSDAILNVAMNNGGAVLEELRLQADNVLKTDWAHGRALHTLLDAFEDGPVTEAVKAHVESLGDEVDELQKLEELDDIAASIETMRIDLTSMIATRFENLTSDLLGPLHDDITRATQKEIERMSEALQIEVREHCKRLDAAHAEATDGLKAVRTSFDSVISDLEDAVGWEPK